MIPIHDFLQKIKWDEKENLDEYEVAYFDQVQDKYLKVPYTNIKRIEQEIFIVEQDGKESTIPLHQIKKIFRQGDMIWERPEHQL